MTLSKNSERPWFPPMMKASNGDVRGAMLTRLPDCVNHASALEKRPRFPPTPPALFRMTPLLQKTPAVPLGPAGLLPCAPAPALGAGGGVPGLLGGVGGSAGAGVTSTARITGPLTSVPASYLRFSDSRFTLT